MAARAKARDPYKRRSTRYRGISYRERADGGRTYYVYAEGRHHRVEGDEQEALAVQADLRGTIARGLRVRPEATTFAELAEEWFQTGSLRWRPPTGASYRIALDRHLLPRFGRLPLAELTPDLVARVVAERQAEGASGSYMAANLGPLNGTLKLALRRGLIAASPVAVTGPLLSVQPL